VSSHAARLKTPPMPLANDMAGIQRLQTTAGNAAVASLLGEAHGAPANLTMQRAGAASAPAAGKSLTDTMPAGLDPTSASVRFTLRGGMLLAGGDHPVSTSAPTDVELFIDQTHLVATFSPALVIDVTGRNVSFSRLEYDFTTASGGSNPSVATAGGLTVPFVGDTAELAADGIRSTFLSALPASMKTGKYNPATDPNPGRTLNYIAIALNSGPTTAGGPTAKDVSKVRTSTTITAKAPFMVQKPAGTVVLPAGGKATLRISFAGTAADMLNPATLKIDSVSLTTDSLTLQKDGEDVAVITSLHVDYGGKVHIDGWEARGQALKVQGDESAARLFMLMLQLSGGGSRDRLAVESGRGPSFAPTVTTEVIRLQLETTIEAAVASWIKQNPQAVPIPGVDLARALGL
jgi:hypothetical protein